jgi:hypothetical protein
MAYGLHACNPGHNHYKNPVLFFRQDIALGKVIRVKIQQEEINFLQKHFLVPLLKPLVNQSQLQIYLVH